MNFRAKTSLSGGGPKVNGRPLSARATSAWPEPHSTISVCVTIQGDTHTYVYILHIYVIYTLYTYMYKHIRIYNIVPHYLTNRQHRLVFKPTAATRFARNIRKKNRRCSGLRGATQSCRDPRSPIYITTIYYILVIHTRPHVTRNTPDIETRAEKACLSKWWSRWRFLM